MIDIRKVRGIAYRSGGLKKNQLKSYFQSKRKLFKNYGDDYSLPIIEKKWITKSGLTAVVIMTQMGHRCGYVAVNQESSLIAGRQDSWTEFTDFNVHGGITYHRQDKSYPVWNKAPLWLGYDCGHASDAPALGSRMSKFSFGGVHRELDYCIQQCELLATQIAEK